MVQISDWKTARSESKPNATFNEPSEFSIRPGQVSSALFHVGVPSELEKYAIYTVTELVKD